ncbi:MAG: ATP-binding cassette domain-containing protein [Armatimonadota bacterium]|nr:ATP-binding cassette domain-containing protein [Armatimonadota bacterium]MDR7438383.1 ATP-binding cassette domain-containing protein [Armatimonadota bacterium]MDR7563351.1 ATP-binding cassette domain-containing protein [Armatimonadota bacterium]MDR7568585.1 ATP-binding cassette domain-containing protein [Armatimonadota bacterium]MDR7601227.1 ATP-binding cassette domain-containing protein [Armatimonadota bacterium]
MPLVEMRGIRKRFGAVEALRGVDLVLNAGEILGLVGDNAAGKSTLMKILSGAYQLDEGEIVFEGRRVRFASPADARALGIEMVYQDLALCENLDVAQNIWLGRWPRHGWFVDRLRMDREAQKVLSRLGIEPLPTRRAVATLSGGQRQSVAIARALSFDPKVLILDEPTANLSPAATQQVLALVRTLRDQGMACIFISHRLQEILQIGDRVMVLKQGRNVGVRRVAETTEEELLELIIAGDRIAAARS